MNNRFLFSDEEWELLVGHLGLTQRQTEIIYLLLQGRNDRQIAGALGISFPTVRAHLQRVFESQQVQDRTMLVISIFRSFRELSQ